MGLVIILALGLYLAIAIGVVLWAISYAKKNGKSAARWGWGAALGMYLLVFWDWIPTVLAHKYYCATEAGFWVYKTPEQWKQENPGVMETLVANKGAPSNYQSFENGYGKRNIYLLNDHFNWAVTQQDIFSLLPIIRTEQQVIDVKKNEVLARYIDFGAGKSVKTASMGRESLKFWLYNASCSGGGKNKDQLRNFRNNFMGIEK